MGTLPKTSLAINRGTKVKVKDWSELCMLRCYDNKDRLSMESHVPFLVVAAIAVMMRQGIMELLAL
jgi:hypothetical protein